VNIADGIDPPARRQRWRSPAQLEFLKAIRRS